VHAIKQVRKVKPKTLNYRSQNQSAGSTAKQALCKNCGRTHGPRNCPAFGKECHACKKKNHFAKYCMSTRRKKVDALQYDSTFDDSCDELFICTVSVDSIQQSEDWKESVTINQKSSCLN
jgi:hypothetical protein